MPVTALCVSVGEEQACDGCSGWPAPCTCQLFARLAASFRSNSNTVVSNQRIERVGTQITVVVAHNGGRLKENHVVPKPRVAPSHATNDVGGKLNQIFATKQCEYPISGLKSLCW